MRGVRELLESLGLERYESVFVDEEIDLDTLVILTEGNLEELGLPFGPRKRLLQAIAGLSSESEAAEASSRAGAADEGERRQLTALFCDMVGSTELAERLDPEVLQTVFRTYEDACAVCISRFEGYLYQRLGDCVVAFFGYPHAHEGEAERAIRAALAITEKFASLELEGVGRLHVRSGIATGLVVVSDPRRGAVGETMNLASRLQAIAEPGQIVVSDNVRRLAGGVFEYDDLGEQRLKGISKPTHAYHVKGLSGARSRFEASTRDGVLPLVGRDSDLRVLLDRWQCAKAGEGHALLVAGEAGIGKSRIVSALREHVMTDAAPSISLQCSPFHINTAFYPFTEYLQREAEIQQDEPAEASVNKLEALLRRRLGTVEAGEVRLFSALLSVPLDTGEPAPALSPPRQKELTVRALIRLVQAHARAGPSLVIVEDLHWADPTTLEVIGQLIGEGARLQQVLVMTARPEFAPPWFNAGHFTMHSLARLMRSEAIGIVSRITDGKPLPPGVLQLIMDKTDGIPLFVEELTRSVLESGGLREAEDRYEYVGGAADLPVPATLRDSLMARLDRVTAVKEIAQVGATIGREFSHELVSAVAPMSDAMLAEGLTRLTESGLAFRQGTPPRATYVFKHALVQEVAYDSLLKRRRHELHARIAKTLEERFPQTKETEPELLAHHYTAAELTETAIGYWRQAGERAAKAFALQEATSHLRRGLLLVESLAPNADRDRKELELRTLLGPAVVALRGWADPAVGEALEPALALVRSLGRRESHLAVLHGLWVHALVGGRLDASLEWAMELLGAGDAEEDEDLILCGHRAAMTSYFWLGDLVSAWQHGREIRRLYDADRHGHIARLTNSDPLTADGIYGSQYMWMLGYPDRAVAMSLENHEHARRLKHPFDLAFALTLGAEVFDFVNRPDDLLLHSREGAQIGREHGIPLMSEILAEITKGIAWLRSGRAKEAAEQLALGIDRLDGTGQLLWQPYLNALLAEALGSSGNLEKGLAVIEKSIAEIERRNERSHAAEVLRIKGWLLERAERAEEAEAALTAAIGVARAQQARSWELRATTTLARMMARRGEGAFAAALVKPVLVWFTEGLETHDLREACRFLAEVGVPVAPTAERSIT
jgi:class 3 adenylate cyclase/tetratricopeptide (TPR) repeat protein